MKKMMFVALALSSSAAFAENVVLYCGGFNIEGSYLKVDPTQKTMCKSAGRWGSDYCSNDSTQFEITESRTGSLVINGQTFSFREFLGKSAAGVQLVRVFNDASNPSAADVTVHRADMAGSYSHINVGIPNTEAKDGEAICYEGDDSSF